MLMKRRKKKLTPEQVEQRKQITEVRGIMSNLGFDHVAHVDGNQFTYSGRTSEIDDIYVLENIVLLVEYTITNNVKEHLTNKALIYNLITEDREDFLVFLLKNDIFPDFTKKYNEHIKPKYRRLSQLNLQILYCSKTDISQEHKDSVSGIHFFEYHVVHYFKHLTAALKYSARPEFLRFLGIEPTQFADQLTSGEPKQEKMKAYLIPDVKSYFKEGYKIVTFYMSPAALLKRAYVLRHEGWDDRCSAEYYQRMADPSRIAKIRRFLSEEERVFVNNVIVTLSERDVSFQSLDDKPIQFDDAGKTNDTDLENKSNVLKMTIAETSNSIGIIDGQHRVFAYHQFNDPLESKIAELRQQQTLLVTGVLFPKNEDVLERRKFEARLFMEINVTQAKISSYLQQELSMMVEPYSLTSIGKEIIAELNRSGALENRLELFSYEKFRIKSASIVSFGLRPLIKYPDGDDTLFSVWDNERKKELIIAEEKKDSELRKEYISFCSMAIRTIMGVVKKNLNKDDWQIYSPKEKRGLLSITFINGILNLLRCIIKNKGSLMTFDEYDRHLKDLSSFHFRDYKSSYYRRMGEDLFSRFFEE